MIYTVKWTKRAINQLIQIWLKASDRNAVTAATARIDQVLLLDPSTVGESRPGLEQVTFVTPLGIRFRVFPAERIVRVLSVWNIKP